MVTSTIIPAVDALLEQWSLLVEAKGLDDADADPELKAAVETAWGRPLPREELLATVVAQGRRMGRQCWCGGWGHLPRWAVESSREGFRVERYTAAGAATPTECIACHDTGDGLSARDLRAGSRCTWCDGSGLAPTWATNAPFGDLSCARIDSVRGWFPSWCCVCGGFGRMAPPRPPEIARIGEAWRLMFAGTEVVVRDLRGLHYIARVMEAPRQEVRALDLVDRSADTVNDASVEGLQVTAASGLAERIDPAAAHAYRVRLRDLESALTEARERGDDVERERLEAEQDALVQELKRARHSEPTDARRARDSVGRAIRTAIHAIDKVHPELAAHLHDRLECRSLVRYRP